MQSSWAPAALAPSCVVPCVHVFLECGDQARVPVVLGIGDRLHLLVGAQREEEGHRLAPGSSATTADQSCVHVVGEASCWTASGFASVCGSGPDRRSSSLVATVAGAAAGVVVAGCAAFDDAPVLVEVAAEVAVGGRRAAPGRGRSLRTDRSPPRPAPSPRSSPPRRCPARGTPAVGNRGWGRSGAVAIVPKPRRRGRTLPLSGRPSNRRRSRVRPAAHAAAQMTVWLELFYDLVFVAAILVMSTAVSHLHDAGADRVGGRGVRVGVVGLAPHHHVHQPFPRRRHDPPVAGARARCSS